MYSSDGKETRSKRAEQRELCQTALDKLGDKEYKRLLQEIDWMTHTSVDINKLIDKRVKEIEERMELERREEEATSGRVTRSQAGTSTGTTEEAEPIPPQVKSPRKRGKQEGHKETGGKKPRMTTKQEDTVESEKPDGRKDTCGKKPKTPKAPQHIDDDANDESMSHKEKGKEVKAGDTVDKSKDRSTKNKKTAAIPLLEDDDDDDLDDLMVVDDENRDANYEPEDEQMDDDDFPVFDDDDDDDFQEPTPRARKDTKKEQKQVKKKSTQ